MFFIHEGNLYVNKNNLIKNYKNLKVFFKNKKLFYILLIEFLWHFGYNAIESNIHLRLF